MINKFSLFTIFTFLFSLGLSAQVHQHLHVHHENGAEKNFIRIKAPELSDRNKVANLGYALESIIDEHVFIVGNAQDVQKIQKSGYEATLLPQAQAYNKLLKSAEFQSIAKRYRSHSEIVKSLEVLAEHESGIASLDTYGTSTDGRDLNVLRISSKTIAEAQAEAIPTIIYQGCHHAREHLSVEIPLRFAEYLVNQYGKNDDVTRLVDSREIYVIPLVNPDGYAYDYRDGVTGKNWRKNRKKNSDGTVGVDLNRNYPYKWGTGGSSSSGSSDVFMGPAPFSENETDFLGKFIESQDRMKLLMDFHSFSQLILYPWGYTSSPISNSEDQAIHETMANKMSTWNNYKPQAAADLYIASGTSLDWIYGELGIINFTFELDPANSFFGDRFYLNPSKIDGAFQKNLKPMLYMLEYADEPKRVLTEKAPSFLDSPSRKGIPIASFQDIVL